MDRGRWFGLLWPRAHGRVFLHRPHCVERGLGEVDAAAILSTFAISLAVMHLAGGMLADRLPASRLLALGLARDQLGSFQPALVAFTLATIPLALLSLMATPPAQRP